MRKESKVIVFLFFIALFTMSFASASFKYSGENIIRNYVGGEKLKGYINLSLSGENAEHIFKSNYNEQGIKLIDLIEKNGYVEGINFNCTNVNCQNTFETNGEISGISINPDLENDIGIRLSRDKVVIEKLSFRIDSDAQASCFPILSIEILGNESVKLQGNAYNDVACGNKIKGCFDENLGDYDNAKIGRTPFCQKLDLPNAPAFRIGAEITNSAVTSKLTMRLFDDEWNPLGNCILASQTELIQESSCIINFTNVYEGEYYACIETDSSNSGYTIKSEAKGKVCGVTGINSQEYDGDYNIFAQALEYNPGQIIISSDTLEKSTGVNLIDFINEYIDEKYLGNCSDECVVPFKIYSSNSQNILFSNITVEYLAGGTTLTNDKLYLVEENKAKITSKNLKIDIEKADLNLPLVASTKDLQLYINNDDILPKKIKLNISAGFSFDVSPKIVPFAIETDFFILSNQNITSVKWNFGDGETRETTNGEVKYTYFEDGTYNITLEVVNTKNVKSIQNFIITVGDVSESINKLLNQTQNKINSLTSSINVFEPWIKEELLNLENITNYQTTLNNIKNSINNDSNKSYSLVSEIYSMDIPKSVAYTDSGKLPLEVGFDSIDSEYLIQLASTNCKGEDDTCENYDWVDKTKVNDYIIYWNSEKFNSEINYKTITKYDGELNEPILTYFNIEIKKKGEFSDSKYLILPYPLASVKFKSSYGAIEIKGESDGIAIPISEDTNIEFLISGKVEPSELSAFTAPSLEYIVSELKIEPSCKSNPDLPECTKRSGFWLYILLFIGFIIIYIILQEWYKRKYEVHLFPNRDELYNLINYIHNSRVAGMVDGQIIKSLYDLKWNGEQIKYAFNKIEGKRTGMWEIPLFKFLENKKVKTEIDKRNQNTAQNPANGGNVRFFNGTK